MQVTRARLEAYRGEVDSLGDAAATYVEQYVRALLAEFPGARVSELRDEAIEAVSDALNVFGDQASELALDLFEEVVADYGMDVETSVEDVVPGEMVDGGVRYAARRLVEGDPGSFARDVADLTRYYIHRSAFENMERNCVRNDLRYARVPSGRETCGFCFMLSSRGFVYRSEETAGSTHAYHRGCDCVIVPGFKGVPASDQVEGYDPDGMRERWAACQDAAGTDSDLRDRWDAMTKEQRSRYKGKSDPERYHRFVNAQAIREAETRDFRWLNTGDEPEVNYANVPRESFGRLVKQSEEFNPADYDPENVTDRGREWRDLFLHDALKHAGFEVEPIRADAPERFSNIDALVGGKLYEFKSPEEPKEPPKAGRELAFVESNLRSAKKQFLNQYDRSTGTRLEYNGKICVVFSARYRKAGDDLVEREIVRQMGAHEIDEVLFVRKDGSVARLRI